METEAQVRPCCCPNARRSCAGRPPVGPNQPVNELTYLFPSQNEYSHGVLVQCSNTLTTPNVPHADLSIETGFDFRPTRPLTPGRGRTELSLLLGDAHGINPVARSELANGDRQVVLDGAPRQVQHVSHVCNRCMVTRSGEDFELSGSERVGPRRQGGNGKLGVNDRLPL